MNKKVNWKGKTWTILTNEGKTTTDLHFIKLTQTKKTSYMHQNDVYIYVIWFDRVIYVYIAYTWPNTHPLKLF